jgi:hypothetical protein
MAANRLDLPGSKLACATSRLPDVAFLPDASGLGVDQLKSGGWPTARRVI